jgi:hypothetical protein
MGYLSGVGLGRVVTASPAQVALGRVGNALLYPGLISGES